MNKNTVLLMIFALFFAYANPGLVFAQNQSLSSQLLPSPKNETNNTTILQNQSNPLQIETGQPQGEATPLGGLGQQQPSPTQNQNQTNGPLEHLGESVGKLMDGNK
jgi:hypothetical protein